MSEGVFLGLLTALKVGVMWGVILGVLPFVVWAERRVAGLIQDRPGPNRVGPYGLLQSLADVIKMFVKEDISPTYSDKLLHLIAPLIIFFPALTAVSVIPFGSSIPVPFAGKTYQIPLVIADVNIGLLLVLALTSLGVYGIVLAGWSSNDKFSLLGGIRSSAQIISYELSMGLSAVALFLTAGSLRLSAIVAHQEGTWLHVIPKWNCIPQLIGCVIFVVSVFAETNRLPFDLAEAEAELVAGFHTEYSSFRFGMFFMSEYMNLIVAASLITTLYFGGWYVPGMHRLGLSPLLLGLLSILVFFAKVFFFVFVFLWVRWTLPRFRYDQLMGLGWKVFLPLAVLNLLAMAALVTGGVL